MVTEYVTLQQYFGGKPCDEADTSAAAELLARVNALLSEYEEHWGTLRIDPDTGTYISGAKGGSGDGGFRLCTSTTGAPHSNHRKAKAVDIADQDGALNDWLTDGLLVKYRLFREHPDATPAWCHLQSVPPKSCHRTFYP